VNEFIYPETCVIKKDLPKTYVITNDLVEYTEKTVGKKLSKNAKNRIKEIGKEINRTVKNSLPNDVRFSEIGFYDLKKKLSELEGKSSYPVITIDPLYSRSRSRFILQYNRIMFYDNNDNLEQTEGPRPGFPPLDSQIQELSKQIKEQIKEGKVSLSDVGAWKGNTIISLVKKLRKYGLYVDEVILGIVGIEALENLRKNGINSVLIGKVYNFSDWVEQRDFSIGGRVLGDFNKPFLVGGKVPVRIPYWASEKTLEEWASIPKEKSPYVKRNCIEQLFNILDVLEDELGRPVKVKDIGVLVPTGVRPRDIENSNLKPEDDFKKVLKTFLKEVV
jgi:hypothetical protein